MIINRKLTAGILMLALSASTAGAVGYLPQDNDTTRQEQKDHPHGPKDKKGSLKDEKKKKLPAYEELIKKGGSVQKGLFTVRHIEDKWYFEVPDTLLDRMMLAVTRFNSVPQDFGKFAGEEVNEEALYWELRDEKTLLLRAYVLTQIASDKDRIAQTLKASTTDPIVAAFKVIGRNKKKDARLIEVTPLFIKDNNVTSIGSSQQKNLKLGGLQADRTFIDTMKVYPLNIEIATTRTYATSTSKTRASMTGQVTLGLNTSIVLLPKEPMRKRLWDERIGYFTNRFTLFSDDQHKTDREQFVSRYRLVPKDLKRYRRGELVEPVKPIVYYIDPATPRKWVKYLMAGINDWNVAFEAAGFKNAIIAKEWPDDPDMSVDDARYCVLRYLPSETENAYGPRVVDPRSGEIIESHICWYHNVMNLLTKWYMTQCGPLDKRARTMKFDDELMGQLIRFVSSHEVGHTLGLRHNMGASHATPVEKLRDKAWVEAHGHTASIMDYARFNYVAQPEDGIGERGLFPRIGDYDKWAIKWGYQYRPEFKDEFEEKEQLMTETTKVLAANPRLWFGGEGRKEDPRAQTEDLGDDNVKASDYGIKNLKRVVAGLPEWTRQTNDRHDDLQEMWKSAKGQFNRYNNHVMKNIGGRYLNNMPGRKPYEVAPASRQREAVAYFGRQLFDAPLWLYPQNIVDITGTDVAGDISSQQTRVLKVMMTPAMLGTIYDDSFSSQQAYRLPDYLADVFAAVWRPLTGASPIKDKTRRTLERAYLENINSLLNPTDKDKAGINARANNSDIQLYVEQHLDRVERFCKAQAATASGIDKLHYADLLRQIKLIKEERVTVKGGR